jgi:hypothetical protein
MNTASPKGKWRRVQGGGWESVWVYELGPRFLVEISFNGGGWFVFCSVGEGLLDATHLQLSSGVRRWICECWQVHLESLTWHEKMEYIEKGLIEEAD